MNSSSASSRAPGSADARLRGLWPEDRAALEWILRQTRVFRESEIQIALELIDEGILAEPGPDPYRFFVAELADGSVAGYACYGSTPSQPGVYDLYWIAVDPRLHGQGVGQRILRAVEETVAAESGTLIVVETSGRPDYAPTRKFYERAGYSLDSVDKDYYAYGDDKVVYVKRFPASAAD